MTPVLDEFVAVVVAVAVVHLVNGEEAKQLMVTSFRHQAGPDVGAGADAEAWLQPLQGAMNEGVATAQAELATATLPGQDQAVFGDGGCCCCCCTMAQDWSLHWRLTLTLHFCLNLVSGQ